MTIDNLYSEQTPAPKPTPLDNVDKDSATKEIPSIKDEKIDTTTITKTNLKDLGNLYK